MTTVKNQYLTFSGLTNLMLSAEKAVNEFNKKYNFDYNFVPAKEVTDHEANLSFWDTLKNVRNELKADKARGVNFTTVTIEGIEWIIDLTK